MLLILHYRRDVEFHKLQACILNQQYLQNTSGLLVLWVLSFTELSLLHFVIYPYYDMNPQ